MKAVAALTRILALSFVLTLAGVVMSQERLLYFPQAASIAELTADPGPLRAVAWPAAADFRGLLAEPVFAPVRGTVLVFHGNAGHVGHRLFYAEILNALGLRVILAEYPGYGPRPGKLDEDSLVADAVATINEAQRQFGPLILFGESLGAGVAAAASDRLGHAGIAGLLLVTPWDSLASVAAHHYPWLPVRWLLHDRYDSAAHLAGYRGRAVVVIAERDRIVPPEFGRALFDSLAAEKTLHVVADADHNDWVERTDAAWWRETLAPLLPPAGPTNDPGNDPVD